ncbi:hypothetical protein CYLTODRAFT_420761 [Cylindrobasidium torrendii FP15055 ss-10]|uniref:Uncharacterized protein n=1 Tax=Cylindrobasidium torrendii FP15055 ss-10 TaxID=1314674 RepID=A0A0D7BI80_9AGAR|nr:hypothetical protein CYLTODRAFT_420761 [Cylindrobasidium torrendii FP15055 ss-10]
MWCDNCLLVFPLRGGAMAWALFVAAYSLAGSLFLLIDGQYLFFTYPEWFIYGGIGMAVCAVSLINVLALSNRSYVWSRVCKFLWPFIIVISAIRAILMIVQLQRTQDKIQWECNNGGALWSESAEAGYATTATFPSPFCTAGSSTLLVVFIISLLIDLVCQIYMYFLAWRFSKRLEHYSSMKGPFNNGYYNA